MSLKERICMYDKNHILPIYDKNGQTEERNLNISVFYFDDCVQIKLRDPLEYCFNYTETIDLGDFEVMRVNQSLDINFNEFKSNLIEMLQQFQKKEMFLKCETSNQKCILVFYGKSKIKSIIFLTVDLHITNQKEIFSELINNMQQIQDTNERLKKQLTNIRASMSEKDQQIQHLTVVKTQLEAQFYSNLKQLDSLFVVKIKEVENLLMNKIMFKMQKVTKLIKEVEIIKRESGLKSESSARLLKTMENLRLETIDNAALINQLKKENSALHAVKTNQEKNLIDLRKNIQEKDAVIIELHKKNDELKSDVEKAAVMISQKRGAIDELSKDLVQANQMLVNFNNHYDNKAKQVEELQGAIVTKEKVINEQQLKINDLLREFQEYKMVFNTEEQHKLKHELLLTNNKIEELEKSIRKANKINALLTEKVNNQNFGIKNN